MKKYGFITLITFIILILATPVQAESLKFSDVKRDNTHFNGIYTLEKEGTITGYTDEGKFKPGKAITRSQTAALFTRSMNLDTPENKNSILNNYRDIKPTHDYADEIAATYENGIITGSNGKFNDGSLTREQMATVLVRAYDLKDTGKKVDAKLSNVGSSHRDNVKILFQHEITNQAGDFRPYESVTRGQFATFLYRTAQNIDNEYQEMSVDFIDVGQGDSILIQTTNGENILIDAGTQSAGQKVVSYLKEKDVGTLDMIVATHPHADHIGGLIPVLNEINVDKFVDSGMEHTSKTYENLLNLIDEKDIDFEIPKIGDKYSFQNFDMEVLHVDANAKNANDASIALKGEYDDVSFMLTGDAEKEAERQMVNSSFNLKSNVYKAGHHGSNTSSTQSFINKVKPETSILSYGEGNSYNHPSSDVVKRLDKAGSDIYSTAEEGNIEVMANGVIHNVSANKMDLKPEKPKPEPEPDPKPEPEPEKPSKPKPEKPEVTFPLNINKASAEELKELDGIGDTLSKRIVNYRKKHGNFKNKSDIQNVKQLGPATYKKIKGKIKV